jgi:hypothetical protein
MGVIERGGEVALAVGFRKQLGAVPLGIASFSIA